MGRAFKNAPGYAQGSPAETGACYAAQHLTGPWFQTAPGSAKARRTMEALPAGSRPEDEALFEELNQYFVIEIWVEQAATGEADAVWRARVSHGPSGERWVVRSVGELNCRIAQVMGNVGLV